MYESYFAQVQASNPTPKVHPYFDRLIKPLLERKTDEGAVGDVGDEMDLEAELGEMREEREEGDRKMKERAANGKGKDKGKVKKELGTSGGQQDQ